MAPGVMCCTTERLVFVVGCADLDTGAVMQLVTGHDFFSSPVLSPDGTKLAL